MAHTTTENDQVKSGGWRGFPSVAPGLNQKLAEEVYIDIKACKLSKHARKWASIVWKSFLCMLINLRVHVFWGGGVVLQWWRVSPHGYDKCFMGSNVEGRCESRVLLPSSLRCKHISRFTCKVATLAACNFFRFGGFMGSAISSSDFDTTLSRPLNPEERLIDLNFSRVTLAQFILVLLCFQFMSGRICLAVIFYGFIVPQTLWMPVYRTTVYLLF